MEVSAELLGQPDDDALRATQKAEPVDVLVLRDLADEFGTVAAQAGNDVVDVVDSEHDAAYASVFAGALSGSALTAGGVWNFVSSSRLSPSGPVSQARRWHQQD
jgi:hypothetical protein